MSKINEFIQNIVAIVLTLTTISNSYMLWKEIPSLPFIYDKEALHCTIEGRTWDNVFSYTVSPNQRYVMYVASLLNEEPEAYLCDRKTGNFSKLTDNGYFIESDIHVDDDGNWALSLTETSNSASKIILNSTEIATTGWNHSLCFVDGDVFYASYDVAQHTSSLYLYDSDTEETKRLLTGYPMTTGISAPLDEQTVLLETYDLTTNTSTVMAVHLEAEESEILEPMTDGAGISFLRTDGGDLVIEQVTGDANAMYLFNAYYWIWRYQTLEPWSGATDSTGRISWNLSERLLGELELYRCTKDMALKTRIGNVVHQLIATRKAAQQTGNDTEDWFLFPSKKYSMDQQSEMALMVNNAMIYTVMLQAANAGCLEETDRAVLLDMAKAVYDYYEADWDESLGGYRFRRGIPYWPDGIMMPFNQQNAFGLCLIELWKATGNEIYQKRATTLANSLTKEIEITSDGRAVWHYWPQAFYAGWTAEDDVSDHTPEQAPIEEKPYEDSFHAALNAYFLIQFTDTFGYDVVPETVIQGIKQTAASICTDQGYSSVIEPLDEEELYTSCLWAAAMGLQDRNGAFAQQLLHTDTFQTVEFDNQLQLYGISRFIDMEQNGALSVLTKRYTKGGNCLEKEQVIQMEEISRYAKRFGLSYKVQ